jgi:predicted Fe-Mo cluster-binding NifX family protein
MGRRIYHDLQTAGIEAFIVQETEAEQAIQKYLQNQLQNFPDQGCEH